MKLTIDLKDLHLVEAPELLPQSEWQKAPTTEFPVGKGLVPGMRARPENGVGVPDPGGLYLLLKVLDDGTGVYAFLAKPKSIVYEKWLPDKVECKVTVAVEEEAVAG